MKRDPADTDSLRARFDISLCLKSIKHYLPAQSPLKDFVHHNTLHAFQNLKFDDAIIRASKIFGYRTSLSLARFRTLYEQQQIRESVIERVVNERRGPELVGKWKQKLLFGEYSDSESSRIGVLRATWKKAYQIDMDSLVHPTLFRII